MRAEVSLQQKLREANKAVMDLWARERVRARARLAACISVTERALEEKQQNAIAVDAECNVHLSWLF